MRFSSEIPSAPKTENQINKLEKNNIFGLVCFIAHHFVGWSHSNKPNNKRQNIKPNIHSSKFRWKENKNNKDLQRCGFQSEMNKTKRKKSIRKIKTTCDNTKKQLTLLLLLCVSMWKKLRSILLFYFHVVDFSEVLLITTEMRMHKMMVTKKKKKKQRK